MAGNIAPLGPQISTINNNMINIDYEYALDFGHCEDIHQARGRLSEITNILNRIISVRQKAKKDILEKCAEYRGENLHKLSWDNKLVRIAELSGSSDLVNLWQEAEEAYRVVKNKQAQIIEDLMALKKVADITPR